MVMLLLLSAVALLVSPAVVSLHHIHNSDDVQQNLNRLYGLADKCSESLNKEVFVEDVSLMAEGRCKDMFFCKVHAILHNHEDLCKREDNKNLVRTLQMYNDGRNVKCEETLQGISSTGYHITVSRLLKHVKRCVQRRNIGWTKK